MLFSTIGQIYVFLWMVGTGLFVGALYSIEEGLRNILEAGFWLTLFIDAVFGVCTALTLILSLIAANYGQLRLYELPAVLIGLFLYQKGVSPLLHSLLSRILQALRHIFVRIRHFRLIKVIFK